MIDFKTQQARAAVFAPAEYAVDRGTSTRHRRPSAGASVLLPGLA